MKEHTISAFHVKTEIFFDLIDSSFLLERTFDSITQRRYHINYSMIEYHFFIDASNPESGLESRVDCNNQHFQRL
jgi:hypothetical protein